MTTSTLPRRYASVLEQFQERVDVLHEAQQQQTRVKANWGLAAIGLAVVCALALFTSLDARADKTTAGVPYSAGRVLASAGVAPTPGDFAPPLARTEKVAEKPASSPSPAPSPASSPSPAAPRSTAARAVAAAPRQPPVTWQVMFEDQREASLRPSPSPAAPRLTVGTRLSVRLAHDTTTALQGAPVAATLTADVLQDGAVLVPAGTQLFGEAFATPENDRAQINWSAIVMGGRSHRLSATALGQDDQIGVPGKVVRKASRAKRGIGTVLGAVGRAVTFGAIGGSGVAQRAATETATRVGSGLDDTTREWVVSDKGIKLTAGTTVTVVLRADVELTR